MNPSAAVAVLQNLLDGLDPISGGGLPEQSPYHHPSVIRALACAVNQLASAASVAAGSNSQPVLTLCDAEPPRDYEGITPWEEVASGDDFSGEETGCPSVSLSCFVRALVAVTEGECRAYLNRTTGEVRQVTEEDCLAQSSGEWLVLMPDWEVKETILRESFPDAVYERWGKTDFLAAVRSGNVAAFNQALSNHNLWGLWADYLQGCRESVAIKWLEAHGLAYRREPVR
jgi:hypothetical protein